MTIRRAIHAGLLFSFGVFAILPAPPAQGQTQVGLGGGGSMYAPVVSPWSSTAWPKTMFVACDMTGLYRSVDGGQSWTLLDQHEVHGSTRFSVAFDPATPGHVLGFQPIYCTDASCTNQCASGNCNQGLMESRDGGVTWTPYSSALPRVDPLDSQPVQVTAAQFTSDLGLLIGTTKGIYRVQSSTWTTGSDHALPVPNQNVLVNDMDVISFVSVMDPVTHNMQHFVATVTDVFHWNSATTHWDPFGPVAPTRPIGTYITTDSSFPPSRIRGFAGGANGSHYVLYVTILTDPSDITTAGGVYRYDSSTGVWTRETTGLNLGQTNNTTSSTSIPPNSSPVTINVASSATAVAGNLAILDPNTPQAEPPVITAVPSATSITLYRVVNPHTNPAVQITGVESDCAALAVPRYERLAVSDGDPDSAYVSVQATTCSPYVYRGTFNGSQISWVPAFDGFQGHDGTYRPANNLIPGWIEFDPAIYGGLGFGFGGAAHGLTVDPQSSATLVLTNNAAVLTSTNSAGQLPPAAKGWTQSYTQLKSVTGGTSSARWQTNGLNITTAWNYVFHPYVSGVTFIPSTDIGLARSNDSGSSWLPISQAQNPTSGRLEEWQNFYQLAFEDPLLVPAGAKRRLWAAVATQHDIPLETQLDDAKTTPGDGAVIYSEDDGLTWTRSGGTGLPAGPVVSIVYKAGTLYASIWGNKDGTNKGVYTSTDRGNSWTAVGNLNADTNTTNHHFYRLQFDQSSGVLYVVVAATQSPFLAGGLYKLNGSTWQAVGGANLAALGNIAPTDYALDLATGSIYLCAGAVPGSNPGAVYRYSPATNNWTQLGIPFTPGYHDSIVTFAPFVNGSTLYVTTITHGMWSMNTADDGTHATEVTAIPFLPTQRITFDPANNGQAYIATLGAGVWKTTLGNPELCFTQVTGLPKSDGHGGFTFPNNPPNVVTLGDETHFPVDPDIDTGWFNAFRLPFENGTPHPDGAMQAIAQGSMLYFSFKVMNDSNFDISDAVVLGFSTLPPETQNAPQTYTWIVIQPFAVVPTATAQLIPGSSIKVWTGTNGGGGVVWNSTPTTSSPWITAVAAASGTTWYVVVRINNSVGGPGLPMTGRFGLILDAVATSTDGSDRQFLYPSGLPLLNATLNANAAANPSPTSWADATFSGGCAGIHFSYSDIKNTVNGTFSSVISASATQSNTFSVKVHNSGADAPSIRAKFRLASFGLPAPQDWALIGTQPYSDNVTPNPTLPVDVPAHALPPGSCGDSSGDGCNTISSPSWTLSSNNASYYLQSANQHQCVRVDLEALTGNPTFVNNSSWNNFDFAAHASRFVSPPAFISGRYPAATGASPGAPQVFDLAVTLEKVNSTGSQAATSAPSANPQARAATIGKGGREPVTSIANLVVHGCRRTGTFIIIDPPFGAPGYPKPQTFENCETVGGYGYGITYVGQVAVKNWTYSLQGAGLSQIRPGIYRLVVPQDGVAQVTTTVEPYEAAVGRFAVFADVGAGIPQGPFGSAVNPGVSFTAGLEYIVKSNFSAEGILGVHHFTHKVTGDVTSIQFTGGGKVYLLTGPNRPFLRVGLGGYHFTPGTTNFGGYVGGGLLHEFNLHLGLDLAYTFHVANTPGAAAKFSAIQVGVRFVF